MIKVDHLSYSFPQKDLYDSISFTLEDGQHCALIGTSGSGKSTLVDIMMDAENYLFDGKIEIDPDCRIGYVSQRTQQDKADETTVFEYISEEFTKLQNEIASIFAEMETSSDIDALLERYQECLDALNAIGGEDFESMISKKLHLANLMKLRDLPISKLSGGEFKLVQVIKEMLNGPDLMIMDEPDVFLDFGNLNSLKALINSHKQTMLVITHNRYLLNHCFNKIIHLENKKLQEFDGSYVDYNFSLLQTKIDLQELSIADDEEIERNNILIERLRDIATKDADAQNGRSLKARVSLQKRLEERRIEAPFVDMKQAGFSLVNDSEEKAAIALKVSNYAVSFDELLLGNVSFEIQSTDKVALIGPNGTGKTTLLREIFQNNSDAIVLSDGIEVAYLSQDQGETLCGSNTILDEFYEAGFKSPADIAAYLLGYGFNEEEITQKIGSLSGGEKNILQLAKICAGKVNLLLLDEPTSHLDTYSQITLEEAIAKYNGAVLMISHDYYSIINCMDYVLLIEDKTVRKISMRKFRKMIYASHFDKDYLLIEEKKQAVETKIKLALMDKDFTLARTLSIELEELIKLL
ncbi:MAG: ABC-F family ATP-binding cassette domain-containing protein [Clostridiales bacterium]|nr:ABC-F family ATP-binding cassette domain-containing protein [Clostridiales bacterium]